MYLLVLIFTFWLDGGDRYLISYIIDLCIHSFNTENPNSLHDQDQILVTSLLTRRHELSKIPKTWTAFVPSNPPIFQARCERRTFPQLVCLGSMYLLRTCMYGPRTAVSVGCPESLLLRRLILYYINSSGYFRPKGKHPSGQFIR